ncbi:MAG: hypothetical protein CME68_02505 [Halobacteriovoraceae bacterium]|nr:hypothetical protein [Halobacteriovoraceae bacterium]
MHSESIDISKLINDLSNSFFLKFPDTIPKIEKVGGDASTRRYYRVKTEENSYILCKDESLSGPKNNDLFCKTQKILKSYNIPVPELYDANLSSSMILEQDLGDETLLKRLSSFHNNKDEFEAYKLILNIMIKIHTIDPKEHSKENFTKLLFDQDKLMEEVNFTIKYFYEDFLGNSLGRGALRAFKDLSISLSQEKMVPTHRDFHSRNIMCFQGGFYIIDFQDIRMGLPQYDLVSLLEDCYYKIGEENLEKLKNYYYKNYIQIYSNQTRGKFEKLYDFMTIQRTFKAIGSFSYLFLVKKDPRYLKHIGFGMEKIRHKVNKYSELYKLKEELFKSYYEN